MSRPIWPRPGGIRTGRDPGTSVRGALAYDSAEESDAAAGERGGKVLVPHVAPSGVKEMLLHVLGRPPPGLFVGGAAGSQPGVSVHVAGAASGTGMRVEYPFPRC